MGVEYSVDPRRTSGGRYLQQQKNIVTYRKVSNIRRTKSQNLIASRLIW